MRTKYCHILQVALTKLWTIITYKLLPIKLERSALKTCSFYQYTVRQSVHRSISWVVSDCLRRTEADWACSKPIVKNILSSKILKDFTSDIVYAERSSSSSLDDSAVNLELFLWCKSQIWERKKTLHGRWGFNWNDGISSLTEYQGLQSYAIHLGCSSNDNFISLSCCI